MRTLKRCLWMAVLVVLASCSDAPDSPLGVDLEANRSSMAYLRELDVGPALAAQARHGDELMSIPGVVGHGVGIGPDGAPAVVVFTLSPRVDGIPGRVDGVPTRPVQSGRFVALTDETARFRPAPLGVSIGHPDITAGTLGFKVKDGSGATFILSNNHVMANINQAVIGDAILQPGPYDGGVDPTDRIGVLADFVPMDFSGGDNVVDAAIASVASSDVLGSTPSDEGYGQPSSTTVSATVGMRVQKYGRTTAHTWGEVSAIRATVDVCYETRGPFRCVTQGRFVDQIIITPGTFSAGGDSGSGIVTDDPDLNPVGLLFAGSSSHTIANPIDAVLSQFGITIEGGSGNGGNANPTADFSYSCTALTCDFTDASSDSDGSVVEWDWDFGDGTTSTARNPSHPYDEGGTYMVTLTVTDNGGSTGYAEDPDVTVSSGAGGFTLSAVGYKIRGLQKADLEWTGATSSDVEIYRDDMLIDTIGDAGSYTDDIDQRGGGSYDYRVCESEGGPCSNTATVVF